MLRLTSTISLTISVILMSLSIVSSTVNITCTFKSMDFNQTKEDIKTCIPEPFVVENSTDFAQLSSTDTKCEAFFVNNSNSLHLPLGLSNFFPNLKIFMFIDSNLTEIHSDSLNNLTNLIEVSFYKNLLTELKSGIFRDNKLIRKVNFGANKINSIDANAFRGLEDLHEIYLNENELESLDAELFSDNRELITLDLELNKLKMLPMTIFNELVNLNMLNLNNNDLEALPGRIFTKNINLKTLKFTENLITKTDIQNMDFYNNLNFIDVTQNPCTEELSYDIEFNLKEFLDENCKVECEDKIKWLEMESEEKTKRYERVLEELKGYKNGNNAGVQLTVSNLMNEEDQTTVLPDIE